MARYFNDNIRCYEDGSVERLWLRGNKWKKIPDTPNSLDGYNLIGYDNKKIRRHRIIGVCFLGLDLNDKNQTIDHINRIKTDNRVENLRICTPQQQMFNKTAKGYYWSKQQNKWHAIIVLNHKQKHLGFYNTEKEASQAYLNFKPTIHTF